MKGWSTRTAAGTTPSPCRSWAGSSGGWKRRFESEAHTGISIGYRWDTTPTSQVRCVAEFNHIHDVMKKLADGGGIYTLGLQPGTILLGNHIHDVHRSPYASGGAPNNGFFIDEGSKGFLFDSNTVYATSGGAVRFNQNQSEWHTWKDNHFDDAVTLAIIAEAQKTAGLEPGFRKSLLGAH